jgi:hypothetical protein
MLFSLRHGDHRSGEEDGMRTMCSILMWVILLLGFYSQATAFAHDRTPPAGRDIQNNLQQADQSAKIQLDMMVEADVKRILICRRGLGQILSFVLAHPRLFPREKRQETRMLTRTQREQLGAVWQSFLDYCFALDAIQDAYSGFYKQDGRLKQKASFYVRYAAFLTQYQYALAFLENTDNDPTFDIVLNEADVNAGLPDKTFAALKFRFLNVAMASQFVALNTIAAHYGPCEMEALADGIEGDKKMVWQMGKGKGEALTLNNALNIIKRAGFSAWLPVQKGISEWMGDTKVWRQERSLVSADQIRALLAELEPGDILFERREWYLSNIGLPGFWPHVALYVGTAEERRDYFKDDEGMCIWIGDQGMETCDFEALLRKRYPEAYALFLVVQEGSHRPRVVEAISEGVSFTTLEHSAGCDSLAVLRPRLSKKEKAQAILRAFHYQGRPYDFNFDFLTDASLVCSELIYKCYEPSPVGNGLVLPIVDMMGRKLTPPNEIVRQFDLNYASPRQQMDLVRFLDGDEFAQQALPAPLDDFRLSWKRPKWHIFLQQNSE